MTNLFKTICNYFLPTQSIDDYCKAFINGHIDLIKYINEGCASNNTINRSTYNIINNNTALVYIFMIYYTSDNNKLEIKQTFFIYYENGTYKITPYNSNWC